MFIIDLLFPKFCLGCGYLGTYICINCQNGLRAVDRDRCFYCGHGSYLGLTHNLCKRQDGVDGLLCVFRYNPVLKRIIKNIKYRLVKDALNELLTTIPVSFFEKIGNYKTFDKDIMIQPVPLHPNRLKKRGFNQAGLAGQYISSIISIPLTDNLIRRKDTYPQAMLASRKNRASNLSGAFCVSDKDNLQIARNVILVDDVVTTGATCRQAARVLKRSGALNVYIVALAKG